MGFILAAPAWRDAAKRERDLKEYRVCQERIKCLEGTQERFVRRVEWTWIMRESYTILTASKQAWEQLRQEGLRFWRVASVGKDVSTGTVRTPLSMWFPGKSWCPSAAAGLPPIPAADVSLQHCKNRQPGTEQALISNTSNTEASCSRVLIQRSGFGLRIRSQSCSQSCTFPYSCQSFFISRGEALESWVDLLYPQANNRKIWPMLYQTAWVLRMLRAHQCQAALYSWMNSLSFMEFIQSWYISYSLPCFCYKDSHVAKNKKILILFIKTKTA